ESPHKFVGFAAGVALAFPVATVAGTNFQVCLAKVQNGTFGVGVDVGGTDDHGYPVNVSVATGITYSLCVQACGGGQEPFQWSIFSQQFSAWLLPWLALVSQLPFGANDKLDNLDSVLLTVGSPTLAAYSLILTVLNSRWVTRHFARYTYPNVRNAIRILSSLQQSPIRVVKEGGLLASLIVLPQNDEWWTELSEWIDYTHTWSISAATSIAWVVIAYTFTIIDSFTVGISNSNSNGQGVGSLWLWLLPIVIGWLQISPKCDSTRLSSAVERANKLAHVATDDGHVVLVKEAQTETRAIELTLTEVDDLRRDEKCTAPVFNYARFLPWVQAVEDVSEAFQAASKHFHNHKSVDPSIDWVTVERGQKPNERNRVGTRTQVENYCTPRQPGGRPRSRWGPKVVSRMFLASALALMLQWGTAGAAFIQVWYTPTRGLGCRSASYLLYAVLSTIVWMLLVTSSILTHYASLTQNHSQGRAIRQAIRHRHWPTRVARRTSIILRRLGKLIAAFNSLWVLVACIFQFGSVFDNCYCNSSVFWLHDHAYNVIALLPGDVASVTSAWVGGVCLAGGTAVIYVGVVNVFMDPPLPD
ncbi:hypothetical protein K443DRAFT_108218, partial [Laccaria amethystina LaAM-08-1]